MKMQRRQFELITSTIAQLDVDKVTQKKIANDFMNALRHTNPNFRSQQFFDACMTGKMGKGRSHKNVSIAN